MLFVMVFLGLATGVVPVYSMEEIVQPEHTVSWGNILGRVGVGLMGGYILYANGYWLGEYRGRYSSYTIHKHVLAEYDDRWEEWDDSVKRLAVSFMSILYPTKFLIDGQITLKSGCLVATSLGLFPIRLLWEKLSRNPWRGGWAAHGVWRLDKPYCFYGGSRAGWVFNSNVVGSVMGHGKKVKKWKEVPLKALLEVESFATREYSWRLKRAEQFCPGWIAWAIPKCQFSVKKLKINNNELEFHIPIESHGIRTWVKSLIEPRFAKPKFKITKVMEMQDIRKILVSGAGDLAVLPVEIRKHIGDFYKADQITISNKYFFCDLLPYLTTTLGCRPGPVELLSEMVIVDQRKRKKDHTITDTTMIGMLSFFGAIPNALTNTYCHRENDQSVFDGIGILGLKIFKDKEDEIKQALGIEGKRLKFTNDD